MTYVATYDKTSYTNKNAYHPLAIGVEIEAEAAFPLPSTETNKLPEGIVYHVDSSLRGHCAEYVFNPGTVDRQMEKIQMLKGWIKNYSKNTEFNDKSPRTSTHIHLNVSDLSYTKIMNIAFLWWIFEDFFVDWCGPSRVGNNFTLRLRDASGLASTLVNDIVGDSDNKPYHFGSFDMSYHKYCALNLCCVQSIGTLEFRPMGSLSLSDDSIKRFKEWAKQIVELKTRALDFNNPQEVMSALEDENGYDNLAKGVLTPYFYDLWKKKGEKVCPNEGVLLAVAYSIKSWNPKKKKKKSVFSSSKVYGVAASQVISDEPFQLQSIPPVGTESDDDF